MRAGSILESRNGHLDLLEPFGGSAGKGPSEGYAIYREEVEFLEITVLTSSIIQHIHLDMVPE